jgi:four helix bundle protein
MAERFEDLEAWRTARELAKVIFTLTEKEKFSRDYSLKDQIRRASVSAMSNVAEAERNLTKLTILLTKQSVR